MWEGELWKLVLRVSWRILGVVLIFVCLSAVLCGLLWDGILLGLKVLRRGDLVEKSKDE
jgi:hypothetical protein